jgi:hypothetical protein
MSGFLVSEKGKRNYRENTFLSALYLAGGDITSVAERRING